VLPLRDSIRRRRRAWVTWGLVLVNAAIFVVSISQADTTLPSYRTGDAVPVNGFDRFTYEFGFTACELRSECDEPGRAELYQAGTERERFVRVPDQPVLLTFLAHMFMHGSWAHLIGNMLFLGIFGPAVENAMSRLGFLLFYLATGAAASLSHWLTDTASDVPMIGASGAVSGVLGAYLVLYPRAHVLTALPLLFFLFVTEIPALLLLAFYFGLQVVLGSASLLGPDQPYGVAYFAHIGGFVAGMLLARPLATRWRAERRRARAVAPVA
jgi:membrane associated rhomboid family serine protease